MKRKHHIMKYKTILFDADGTLLDFERSEYEALSDVLTTFGIEENEQNHKLYSAINAEQWRLLELGQTTKQKLKIDRFAIFAEQIGVSASATEMADCYVNALSQKSYLIDGAYELCSALHKTHDLYIITNGFRKIQQGRFSPSPIAPFFSGVFISEDIGAEKPSPVYFDYVKSHIKDFCSETTLVVGDSLSSDIAGGIAAGLDVCWFNRSLKQAPPDMKIQYTVSSLSDIHRIICEV